MSNSAPRAVLYARISEDEPNYDKPAVQKKNLRALAAAEGYSIVDEFEDRTSAFANAEGELKDRPGFTALTKGVAGKRYDVVLAIAPDRLSRDTVVGGAFRRLCRKSGVKIHTKTMGLIDLDDPFSRAMATVMDAFGELDVANRLLKQADRFEDEVAMGNPLWGQRPFGFRHDPNAPLNRNGVQSKRWTLHEPHEAAAIQEAYDRLLDDGVTLYSIVTDWNDRSLRTTSAGRTRKRPRSQEKVVVTGLWSYQGIRQVLLRPRNAGLVERKGVIQEGTKAAWEPIVTRERWEAMRALLSDPKRRTAPGKKAVHLMSTLALCGVCGRVMRSASGNGVPVYRCDAKRSGLGKGERHAAITTSSLDPLVRSAIASAFLMGPKSLDKGDAVDVGPLNVELARIRANRQNLLDLVADEDSGVELSDIAKQTGALKKRESEVEAKLLDLTRNSARAAMLVDVRNEVFVGGRADLDKAGEAHDALLDRFDAMPLPRQRELVRAMLDVRVGTGRGTKRVHITHLAATTLNDESVQAAMEWAANV